MGKIFIAYKYRLYTNKEQEELIHKTFGCCRFVYNYMLAYKQEMYKTYKQNINKIDCNNYVNHILKNEYPWLKEVDKFALTNSIFNLDNAYKRFFKGMSEFPKFKNKHNKQKSFKTNNSKNSIEINFNSNKIKLPKLKWVNAKIHREFIGKIKSATISQVPSGKYYISLLIETEYTPMEYNSRVVGIDLGIKDLLITSDGEKFENIQTTKKHEDKLAKEQRKLAHKTKGSKNWNKQKIRVAKVYEKIRNTRIDYLHKVSHKLISENQVIVSENLSVCNMVKNHNLAKSIQDCGWYELTRQINYKAEWNNRQYIKVDRFFKSSQICNTCGYVNTNTKDLSVREWICPQCGSIHDRDINAAKNILNEGLRILNKI